MQTQNKTINPPEMFVVMLSPNFDKSEWEFSWGSCLHWFPVCDFELQKHYITADIRFRKIEKTQVINGFTVPAPVKDWKELKVGFDYYCPCFTKGSMVENFKVYENLDTVDHRLLKRGLIFKTREDALAVAKAMLGIDPLTEE